MKARIKKSLSQFEDADVVVALRVVGIHRDGDLKGLVGQAQISHADRHLPGDIPSSGIFPGLWPRSTQAHKSH